MAHGELLPAIVDGKSRLAARDACLLLQLVESPDLQRRLTREILCNCDQQRGALHRLHVSDGAGVVGLELAHDLEGARHDADDAILASQEDVVGARGDAGDVPLLQTGQGGDNSVGSGSGTSKSDALSASGSLTCETSKNLNGFHCTAVSVARESS